MLGQGLDCAGLGCGRKEGLEGMDGTGVREAGSME